jgi:hypothetical protein
MRIRRSSLSIVALVLLAGCGPRVPKVTLSVDKKLNATFGGVSDVVEIGGGRVAFADPMARRFHTGDFATGSVDTIGVPVDSLPYNAPPSLYRHPGWVALLAGDTVAVVDFGATRTTLWTPAGFSRVLAIPDAGGPTPVLVYDTLGHGYKVDFRTVTGGAEPGTQMRKDSLPVLRLNFGAGTVDTVARLSVPEFGEATFGPQKQSVAQIFGPADIFGVLPDGTVWVARARSMSVDWRSPDGTWTRGPAHRYAKVTVTEADKKKVMDRLHARGLPSNVEVVFPFAKTKPSFEAGIGRPDGEVWLQLSRADEDDPVTYSVIGKDGKMLRLVTAPDGVGITSVSGQYAYGALKSGEKRELVRLPVP